MKKKHWRRLNPYVCKGCGKPRTTLKYKRMIAGLCRKCDPRREIDDSTPSMFGG